jgi:hypothetical protein
VDFVILCVKLAVMAALGFFFLQVAVAVVIALVGAVSEWLTGPERPSTTPPPVVGRSHAESEEEDFSFSDMDTDTWSDEDDDDWDEFEDDEDDSQTR